MLVILLFVVVVQRYRPEHQVEQEESHQVSHLNENMRVLLIAILVKKDFYKTIQAHKEHMGNKRPYRLYWAA